MTRYVYKPNNVLGQKKISEIYRLRPWYHDFCHFGVQTYFPPEKRYFLFGKSIPQIRRQMAQQPRKHKVLSALIKEASKLFSKETEGRVGDASILDLFCSDGYYGFFTQQMIPKSKLVGVDRDKMDLKRCETMSRYLNLGPSQFILSDVNDFINTQKKYDIVLCIGGLYHLTDPKNFLKNLKALVGSYAVFQTSINVSRNEKDYLEIPHPRFKTWGSSFTHARFTSWLTELGYDVLISQWDRREGSDGDVLGGSYALVRV